MGKVGYSLFYDKFRYYKERSVQSKPVGREREKEKKRKEGT
jgi:hypothetical protein